MFRYLDLAEDQLTFVSSRLQLKHQLPRVELSEFSVSVNLVLLLKLYAFVLLRFCFLSLSSLAGVLSRECITTFLAVGSKSILCFAVSVKILNWQFFATMFA